jgi:hypothetical protein
METRIPGWRLGSESPWSASESPSAGDDGTNVAGVSQGVTKPVAGVNVAGDQGMRVMTQQVVQAVGATQQKVCEMQRQQCGMQATQLAQKEQQQQTAMMQQQQQQAGDMQQMVCSILSQLQVVCDVQQQQQQQQVQETRAPSEIFRPLLSPRLHSGFSRLPTATSSMDSASTLFSRGDTASAMLANLMGARIHKSTATNTPLPHCKRASPSLLPPSPSSDGIKYLMRTRSVPSTSSSCRRPIGPTPSPDSAASESPISSAFSAPSLQPSAAGAEDNAGLDNAGANNNAFAPAPENRDAEPPRNQPEDLQLSELCEADGTPPKVEVSFRKMLTAKFSVERGRSSTF